MIIGICLLFTKKKYRIFENYFSQKTIRKTLFCHFFWRRKNKTINVLLEEIMERL